MSHSHIEKLYRIVRIDKLVDNCVDEVLATMSAADNYILQEAKQYTEDRLAGVPGTGSIDCGTF